MKKNIPNAFRALLTRLFCKHKDWYCDKQIAVVECAKCGKRAKITEYIYLFDKKERERTMEKKEKRIVESIQYNGNNAADVYEFANRYRSFLCCDEIGDYLEILSKSDFPEDDLMIKDGDYLVRDIMLRLRVVGEQEFKELTSTKENDTRV